MSTTIPEALLRSIRGGRRFLITSHINPDGDSIASSLGMARVLRQLGKSAVVWMRDAVPPVYSPLPGAARIQVGEEPPVGFPEAFDGVLVMECPSLDRTGLAEVLAGAKNLLNIDHHLGNELYGKANWVDAAAPSAGEMVWRLAQALSLELDADGATLLYLTLVTDTGGFRYANATAAAFDAAAHLVRQGASPERVAAWLYESRPEGMIRLLGEMLTTLELHQEGRVATVSLRREMFRRANAEDGDAEGLINYPRSIAGVEAVALLRELEDEGQFKVSLRSRGAVDVAAIAKKHGGGGHVNAAGCRLEGSEDSLREQMVAELVTALDS
ncbi:MAG: bifunctional oligoribonuclease/PAP phosphatase NrnA [Acidobacteriota bacterium]